MSSAPSDRSVNPGTQADATHFGKPLPSASPAPELVDTNTHQPATPADPDSTKHFPTPTADQDGTRYGAAPRSSDSGPATSEPGAKPRVRLVGDYELLQELGRGGMGVVYKARDLKLGRIVALKMIRTGAYASKDEVERLLAEAKAAAQLDHPHIVPVFDIGTSDGLPYFAMAYVEGGSLQEQLADGPLPARIAARVVQQVAEAVQHAHDRGVVHRDLKPANILLQRDSGTHETNLAAASTRPGSSLGVGTASSWPTSGLPVPKVSDFGLAHLAGQDGLTATGDVLGTPSYMPPEQAEGRVRDIGPHSDVYSLGAVLYCLLTGRPPFQAATPAETQRLVLDQEPVPPRRLNASVPADLQTICLKCLQKSPDGRYASAAALAEDLDCFLAARPIKARPVGVLARGWLWCRRNPVVASLTAVATTLLVFAAVSATIAAFVLNAKADAETKARLALEEQQYDNFIAVAERELTLNQDVGLASSLLEKCPEQLRGWEWDYLMRLRDGGRPPLADHEAGLWMAAFSPDGSRIATASIDGTVKVWDAATGRKLLTFLGHVALLAQLPDLFPKIPGLPKPKIPRPPVMCLAFSPDGRHIASGSFSPNLAKLSESRGVVIVWDAETGRQILTFQKQFGVILSLAYSPDGERIASSSINPEHSFAVWDAATGAVIQEVQGHKSHIHRLRYSPDGRLLASATTDGSVKLWDAATFHEVLRVEAHTGPVVDVAFAPDGGRFATAGEDGTVCVWDSATGNNVFKLRGHTGAALGVAFSPNGKRLASGGFDKTVRVWDAATGKEKITLRGHTDMVWSVAFSPDGRRLVSASFDKQARIWDATPVEEQKRDGLFTITGHTDRVTGVAFSPDGRFLASASLDHTVRLWDAKTGEIVRTLEGHKGNVWCVAFSPDSKRVATASWDHKVKVWEAATGRELLTFSGHTAPVQSVAFSPDSKRVVSGSWDASVQIWDAATGKVTATCGGDLFPTVAVAFSPDGKRVASGRTDRSVVIWDADTGKAIITLKGHVAVVPCVAFSPDGKRLVSASWDHTLKVWDVDPERQLQSFESRELLTLKGHDDRVNGAVFSPDGTLIASASEDKTVRFWDSVTGKEALPPCLHRGLVWSVAFAPDGRRVATGCWSASGWVKTWDAKR